MKEIIAVLVILVIVILAVIYIVKQKKKGNKCIGCPYSTCPSRNKGNCQSQTIKDKGEDDGKN